MSEIKRLFNCTLKDESLNKNGVRFVKQFMKSLDPIIQKWIKAGYSYRDMIYALESQLSCSILMAGLQRTCARIERKSRRKHD